jgi:hypothetical protein
MEAAPMRAFSSWLLCVAVTAFIINGTISAKPPVDKPIVGVILVCDTMAEAVQVIDLRAEGQSAQEAMDAVNGQAQNAHACGHAMIAFTRDEIVYSKLVSKKMLQVTRINVVAGFNGKTWEHVATVVQYTVAEADGVGL